MCLIPHSFPAGAPDYTSLFGGVAMPKLLDLVRREIRSRHYSIRTEEAYTRWIKEFILFHNKCHPADMGEPEVTAFLGHLALDRHIAASTQNQALSALLFLYRNVLKQPL